MLSYTKDNEKNLLSILGSGEMMAVKNVNQGPKKKYDIKKISERLH